MANHKSAKKRHRQSLRRREANRDAKAACRTAVKKTRAAVDAGDKEAASSAFQTAQKLIATAATKNIFHKKTASRLIGRLALAVNKSAA